MQRSKPVRATTTIRSSEAKPSKSKTRHLSCCRDNFRLHHGCCYLVRKWAQWRRKHREEVSFHDFNWILAIIFDLDNVLVKSSYKKDKSREYDACVYMSILNSKKIKVGRIHHLTTLMIASGLVPPLRQGHAWSAEEWFRADPVLSVAERLHDGCRQTYYLSATYS